MASVRPAKRARHPVKVQRRRADRIRPHIDPKIARLLPPLPKARLQAMDESIGKDGVQEPILVTPDGTILEGHHRFRICQRRGIPCPQRVVDVPKEQWPAYALSLNLLRRQMDDVEWGEAFAAYAE